MPLSEIYFKTCEGLPPAHPLSLYGLIVPQARISCSESKIFLSYLKINKKFDYLIKMADSTDANPLKV